MLRSLLALFAVLAASLVCSCGGSSGSEPTPPASAVPALEKVATVKVGHGTAVDPAGNVYVVSSQITASGAGQLVLMKVTPGGTVSTIPLSLLIAGPIASDTAGNIYVSDSELCHGSSGCAIPAAPVQKVAPDGTVTPLPVKGSSDGSIAIVFEVDGLAVDAQGNVDISQGGMVSRLSLAGDLVTIAGAGVSPGQEIDGKGTMARFAGPSGLALDAEGNLYVADQFLGNTIRKIAPDGTVTTIAGMPFVTGSADGPAHSATFNAPTAVAVDASGVIYVADTGNALIRKIDASGNVSTLAGTRGAQGFAPGPLPGVIDPPTGLALFGKDLYFTMDNAVGVVRNAR